MKTVIKSNKLPNNSIIDNGFGNIHYCDSYKIRLSTTETIDQIATNIFRVPKWVNWLMNLRNSIVRVFGLKTGENKHAVEAPYYPVGSCAVYFTVVARNEDEIVMGEDDKHLNFRASVLVDRETAVVYLNTIVRFNNLLGRMYFLPVKPFHKIIIKTLLKKLKKNNTSKNRLANMDKAPIGSPS